MEDSSNFCSFKSNRLEVSFVVVVEERQRLSRICQEDRVSGEEV